MLTGERLAAETALSWGLVDQLTETSDGECPGAPDNEVSARVMPPAQCAAG
jgi:enoyl-CoA hydratase/carnithine racemase